METEVLALGANGSIGQIFKSRRKTNRLSEQKCIGLIFNINKMKFPIQI